MAILVVGGVILISLVMRYAAVLRRLFWLVLRASAAALVAGAGLALALAQASPGAEMEAAPVAPVLAAGVLWLTRRWGSEDGPVAGGRCQRVVERKRQVSAATLVPPRLEQRLAAAERALTNAARDTAGEQAAEWLAFWQRRVPDLIAAARVVYEDADGAEKAMVARRLATHLGGVIEEAERRTAVVRAARRDRFSTLGNHADARVQEG